MAEVEQAALYINQKGMPVTHSSYSSRQTFKHCPRQFQLERIEGWSDRSNRAALVFGKCVEAAVQYYEGNDRAEGVGIAKFAELWEQVKLLPDFKELQYTESEESWEQLLASGKAMLRLYAIRAPFLPISTHPKALWQQVLRKKLFPGTVYDKLENKAVLDILSFPKWNHPLLPKLPHTVGCEYQPKGAETEQIDCTCDVGKAPHRALVIDMKTSGEDLNTELVALDPQLGEYAWQGRIPDVAFLWFVKKSPEFKKGSRVTLLQDVGEYHAGFELLVLFKWEEKRDKKAPAIETVVLGTQKQMDEYTAGAKDSEGETLSGNALKAFKLGFKVTPGVVECSAGAFTKQRLQFAAVRLSQSDMDEIGRDVAQATVEMVRAHQEGYYPKLAGVRFPNQKCNFCPMRWICLGNSEKRDELLSKRGEEWLDGNYETKDVM